MRVSTADGLVGRDAEFAVAVAALRDGGVARASVLVIEGEAGIGKTRLVEAIIDEARSRDVAVLAGQAHPFERARPFGVIAEALDLTRRSADPRRAGIGAVLAVQGGAAPLGTVAGTQFEVVEQIVDLVETSCLERPVLLVAEDIHWADTASLLAILSMARRLTLSPLHVVLTTRPSPQPDEVVRLFDDLAQLGSLTLRLQPLAPDDVVALVDRLLAAAPGPALTAMLAKAGGNPLWVVAMLRSLADEGLLRRTTDAVEATTSELPPSLSELVLRRLRPLPGPTLTLLEIAAVLGDAVSLRDVATVAHRPPTEVVAQLEDAFDARLLNEVDGRVVFRHQLVHDAIYHHIPGPARRLLHREAAAALIAAGADRLDVADHLVLGTERGDEQAVTWLREAARAAAGQAPLVALELLQRAEASARAETQLARRHRAEVDTPLRLALVGSLALQNRATELIQVVQASLADGAQLQPYEQVPLLSQQSWALTYSGDHRAGESVAGQALALAEQAGDAAMTAWALTALLVTVGRQGRHGEALTHARRAAALATHDARPLPLQPKLFLGLALFDCDLVTEARDAYRQALDDEFASGWWLSDTLMADAHACFAIGEWDDAVPRLTAAGQAAREKDHALLLSQSIAFRTIIATGTGDLPAAEELAAAMAGELEPDRLGYNAGVVAFAVAGVKAAAGDQQAAYDLLLRCWRFEAERGDRFYHRCLAPDLVRLALALGQRDIAAEVAGNVMAGVALAPEVPTIRSVALRCQGLVDRDAESLLEAVELASHTPLMLEHAGACEDAAALLAERGRPHEATALLAQALDRYERSGAEAWAGRVRSQLRTLGVRRGSRGSRLRPATGWDSLTATERAVSLLVAEGLTNGAVARRLYISPHTVNTHLRHAFAKLDVSNRVALGAVVHRSIK